MWRLLFAPVFRKLRLCPDKNIVGKVWGQATADSALALQLQVEACAVDAWWENCLLGCPGGFREKTPR